MNNLKINGSQTIDKGIFDEIKVNGTLKITDTVETNKLRVNGTCISENSLISGDTRVNGILEVKKKLEHKELIYRGTVIVNEFINGNSIKGSGTLTVGNSLQCENINIAGSLKVNGDCNSEVFKSYGGLEINGMLNSGDVDISVLGRCKVKEIGGDIIKIKAPKKFLTLFSFTFEKKILEVDIVEGDEIYLQNTKAKVVRGKNITIGKKCEIDLVECTGEFVNIDGGIVKSKI